MLGSEASKKGQWTEGEMRETIEQAEEVTGVPCDKESDPFARVNRHEDKVDCDIKTIC